MRRIRFTLLMAALSPAWAQSPITITSSSPSPLRFPAGSSATSTISAFGGTPTPGLNAVCYSWSSSNFNIPGLSLIPRATCDFTVLVTGTATTPGTYNFSITASDGRGGSASAQFTVIVYPVLETVTTTLPPLTVGVPIPSRSLCRAAGRPIHSSCAEWACPV